MGEARDGHEVMQRVRELDFDVLLLDMSMPGKSGMELIKQVKGEKPKLRILVLSMHAGAPVRGARDQGRRVRLPDQGKRIDASWWRRSARSPAAAHSSAPRSPSSSRSARCRRPREPPHAALSDREYQVLRSCSSPEGRSPTSREQLNLSVKTVSTHKARLMEKMGLANQTELIRYAIKHRLIDDSDTPA